MIKKLAALVAAIAVAMLALAACGGGSGNYSATVVGHSVVNPGTVEVMVSVTNNGNEAGTPDVTVEAHDPGYSYTGIDIFTPMNPIQPGETVVIHGPVTVTGNGAQYATEFKASIG